MTGQDTAILIVVDRAGLTRWLRRLTKALESATGARIMFRLQPGGEGPGSALAALYSLERLVLRRGRPCDADPLGDPEWLAAHAEHPEVAPGLVIDLTAAGAAISAVPVLRPAYDGNAGEEALLSALFFSGTPRIAIERGEAGGFRPVAVGTASLEAAAGISGAVEAVKSRVAILLVKAIREWRHPENPAERPVALHGAIPAGSIAKRAARTIAEAAARAAYHLCFYAPHWHVGWRFVAPGEDVLSRRDLAGRPWNRLAGPADHFHADPFPLLWRGRDFLFFEDLDHGHGKGIISAVEFDAAGRPGPIRPVLEESCHLSYPFLIERDGEVFMIPETSQRREIAIWRATAFPAGWEKLAVLVSGVEAADATVIELSGTWWMFAVTRDGIGGYSDTLEIWRAPDLFGPWQAVAGNPVLVDDRSARPAGHVVRRGDTLYRPVQDCRARYGAALGIARIDRLDAEGFSQTVETTLAPDGNWPGRRLHTLNYNGRMEVIDGEAPRLKFGG